MNNETKEKRLIKKLGPDKYHWAWKVQQNNFPFWSEAFDYALKLGIERGRKEAIEEMKNEEEVR